MNDKPHMSEFEPLKPPLDLAVRTILLQPLPEEAVLRVRSRAVQIDVSQLTPTQKASNVGHSPEVAHASHLRRTRGVMYGMGGLAAALLLIALLLPLGVNSAWAQVTKALKSKPWVHLSLKVPTGQSVPGLSLPETWIAVNHKIGARRFGKAALYLDFARQISESYDPKQNTIYQRSISDTQNSEFAHLAMLLRLVAEDDASIRLPLAPVEILKRDRREVTEGDRRWIEFEFQCRDVKRASSEYRVTFRVDPESHLPFEMSSTEKLFPNDPTEVRSYTVKYPDVGPDSIYALGPPRTATVVDHRRPVPRDEKGLRDEMQLRELLVKYGASRSGFIEPYSAVILVSMPQMAFKDIVLAFQGRNDAEGSQVSQVDAQQLNALRTRMGFGKIEPPNDVDPVIWWKHEISKMPLGLPQGGDFLLPHSVCYPMLVGTGPSSDVLLGLENPNVVFALEQQPTIGPAGTVLLKIRFETKTGFNDAAYWIAPDRGYAVLRSELRYSKTRQDWDIHATIVDTLARSSGGRWYATQTRMGLVKNSGDDLPATHGVAPLDTSVYRCLVEFN